DAGVDRDLGAAADGLDDLGQQVEGDRGAVELAAAVVGKHDAVDAEVGQGPGVLDVLHALDDDLAGPQLADDVEVLETDGGVERVVHQRADGPAGGAERGELQLGSGQEVVPQPRAGDRVEHGAEGDLRRDREAVALV